MDEEDIANPCIRETSKGELIERVAALDAQTISLRLDNLRKYYPAVYKLARPSESRLPYFSGIVAIREATAKVLRAKGENKAAKRIRSYNHIVSENGVDRYGLRAAQGLVRRFFDVTGVHQTEITDREEAFDALYALKGPARALLSVDDAPVSRRDLNRAQTYLIAYQTLAFLIFEQNRGLIYHVIDPDLLRDRHAKGTGYSLDGENGEIMLAAEAALLRAVLVFDPSLDNKFSSLACRTIRSAIGRVQRRSKFPLSFNCRPGGELSNFGEEIMEKSSLIDEGVRNEERDKIIMGALTDLDPSEREIIIRRYGLRGQRAKTLRQISKDPSLELGRERIRQLECRALLKMRMSTGEALQPFLPQNKRDEVYGLDDCE